MMKGTAGIATVLAALSMLSSADNNYYATCVSDPAVGVLSMRRPGKVKGHTSASQTKQCRIGCTRQLSPVCGNDGTTYGNECALCAEACRDHALYLACRGECPCSATPTPTTTTTGPGQGRGDTGTLAADQADAAAVQPQDLTVHHQGPPRKQGAAVQDNASPKTGPRKLKKNPSSVVIVTGTELNIVSGDVTADALNHVTLDLHADMAPESNPVSQSSLWVVEVYHKGKGRSPKQGLVSQALSSAQSETSLEVGQPLDIRGIQYQLDLRGKTCRDVAKVCSHLKHHRTGRRHTRVKGKPSTKVLRSCTKVHCQSTTQNVE